MKMKNMEFTENQCANALKKFKDKDDDELKALELLLIKIKGIKIDSKKRQ